MPPSGEDRSARDRGWTIFRECEHPDLVALIAYACCRRGRAASVLHEKTPARSFRRSPTDQPRDVYDFPSERRELEDLAAFLRVAKALKACLPLAFIVRRPYRRSSFTP